MGKIKITEEQYKTLIEGINSNKIIKEDVSDQECIDKLQDSDGNKYKVVPVSNYEQTTNTCNSKTNIKCVLKLLEDVGFSEDNFVVNKVSGNCYILVKSTDMVTHGSKTIPSYFLTFWDDGDFTLTRTLPVGVRDGDDVFYKLMNEGDFTCDNTSKIYTDLSYSAGIDAKGKKHSGADFSILKSDGTATSYRSGTFLKAEDLEGNGNLKELLNFIK
jgi:hypothetical protein